MIYTIKYIKVDIVTVSASYKKWLFSCGLFFPRALLLKFAFVLLLFGIAEAGCFNNFFSCF